MSTRVAGHQPPGRPAECAGPRLPLRLPRPLRRPAHQSPDRRDVPRSDRRARAGPRGVRTTHPSLYGGPAVGHSPAGARRRSVGDPDRPRRGPPQSSRSAGRLPLPHSLPVRDGRLRRGRAGPLHHAGRHHGQVPSPSSRTPARWRIRPTGAPMERRPGARRSGRITDAVTDAALGTDDERRTSLCVTATREGLMVLDILPPCRFQSDRGRVSTRAVSRSELGSPSSARRCRVSRRRRRR